MSRLKKHPSVKIASNTLGNNDYRIGKTIGKGTYSKVCIAINGHGQKFACKVINKKEAGTDFIEKFLPRELSIITSIKHPNIITVYKVLKVNECVYMFMDYCKNGDLLEYIRHDGPFPEEKAKIFFKQVVEAIFYLHGIDIAHRDLKCENIFLMGNNQVKIGDFGFARHCTYNGKNVLSDTFCGSAAYAAPEILEGISYNPKMYDIWALGCVLYIMLTASMPFDDNNIKEMLRAQINRSVFKQTLLWTENSTSLKKILNSLLEPDCKKRIEIKDVRNCAWLEEGNLNKVKRLLTLSDT